jgi:hypothetical protein
MNEANWHKGPPPHIGWWDTKYSGTSLGQKWLWWGGECWFDKLGIPYTFERVWSNYYPEGARVPRVDPSKRENIGVVNAINMTCNTKNPDGPDWWARKAWEYSRQRWPYTVQGLPPDMAAKAKGYAEQMREERGHTPVPNEELLCQDCNRKLGAWFADRLGAREQLRRM